MIVPAAGKGQRLALFGALDYASGQLLWSIAERRGGGGFAAFLAQVALAWPTGQLVLVLDNVSYHRAPAVRAWWAAQGGRVTPFWLPPYAPNLNLIERVRRFLKQKLACHRFWADRDGLRDAAGTLLDRTEARFHAERPPAIRLTQDFSQSAKSAFHHR